jgi:hypothetical protein
MKLKNKSPERTFEIVTWLTENVGGRLHAHAGLCGYGWSIHYNQVSESYDIYLESDIVDEETQTLFALTCA